MHVQDALGDWSARSGPLYARLAAAIGDAVESGDIPPGAALPPERSLAKRLAIGRSTVVHAYARLREQGVVSSRQGSGTWVTGASRIALADPPRESLRVAALRDPAALIDLATAALPAHPRLRGLIADLAGEDDKEAAALLDSPGYQPAGLPALRHALATRLTEQGLPTSADQVLITTGDQQALSLLAEHALHAGETAVVEDPTSPGMLDVLHGMQAVVRGARPVTDGHEDLLRLVDRCQPSLVYLMPTLGPQGRVLNRDARGWLARALADRDALVVDDVSQAGLAFAPEAPLAACAEGANLVTVGSLSKLHWGGLRLGWARGAASLIAGLARAKTRADLGTPVLDQLLAVRLLDIEDEIRADRLARLRDDLAHATATLPVALPDFRWQPPDGGLNLWLRLPAGTATAFSEVAARFGVAVVPGAVLSPRGLADDHIRLVYARPREVFDEGVRRLAAAWQRYRHAAVAGEAGQEAPVLL